MKGECLLPFSSFLEMTSFWIACGVMGKTSYYNPEDPQFKNQFIQTSVFIFRDDVYQTKYRVTIFASYKRPLMCMHLVGRYLGVCYQWALGKCPIMKAVGALIMTPGSLMCWSVKSL